MARRLDEDHWIDALADPVNPLVFPLAGYDAVARSWAFRERILPDHLMYLLTHGEVVGEIDGTPIQLRPGTHLWMQPGVRHTFELRSPSTSPTVYFVRFRAGPAGSEIALSDRTHQVRDDAWDLRDIIDDLVDELGTRLRFRTSRLRGLLVTVCSAALRQAEPLETSASAGTLSRTQRRLIEGHVRADPAQRVTPAELADLVGLSADYFSRQFTRTFGVPPRAWLVQDRLDRAARALSESMQNVSEVAASLGYDDVSAFSHQFKQSYGTSPRAFSHQQR